MIPTIIILVILVLIVVWLVGMYNGLIALRNRTQEAWRQIDVELKRRHDLIPNLVETVKGYAGHERSTLDAVISARTRAVQAGDNPASAAAAEGQLSQALGRLMAVAEAYPDLKANGNFQQLQAELTSTEDRIASARRYYNATVGQLNTKVESFPTNLFAQRAGIGKEQYFETDDVSRTAPQVNFDTGSARTYDTPAEQSAAGPFPSGGATPVPPAQPTQSTPQQPAQPTPQQPPADGAANWPNNP